MSRSLSAVFCDDIRQEVTGKMMYIGVYNSAMMAPEFPLILPSFCIMATVVTPAEEPFKQLAIRVLLNQTVIQELVISDEALKSTVAWQGGPARQTGERLLLARALLSASPLVIDEPCSLRVVAETESETLTCPALAIRPAPEQDKKL